MADGTTETAVNSAEMNAILELGAWPGHWIGGYLSPCEHVQEEENQFIDRKPFVLLHSNWRDAPFHVGPFPGDSVHHTTTVGKQNKLQSKQQTGIMLSFRASIAFTHGFRATRTKLSAVDLSFFGLHLVLSAHSRELGAFPIRNCSSGFLHRKVWKSERNLHVWKSMKNST